MSRWTLNVKVYRLESLPDTELRDAMILAVNALAKCMHVREGYRGIRGRSRGRRYRSICSLPVVWRIIQARKSHYSTLHVYHRRLCGMMGETLRHEGVANTIFGDVSSATKLDWTSCHVIPGLYAVRRVIWWLNEDHGTQQHG